MKKIQITKEDTTLVLKSNNLNYEVIKNGFSWVGSGRQAHIFFQKKMFGKYLWFPMAFSWAGKKEHKTEKNTITSTFSNFRLLGKKLPLSLTVTASVLDSGKVDFSINAENETQTDIKAVYFPRPFNAKHFNKTESYTVDPIRQGFILPDKHKAQRKRIFLLTKYWRKINTGDAYLPLWGRVCGERGYAGVIDNSMDCSLFSCYDKKNTFLTSSNWLSSLGKLAYKRTVHYHFYDKCDYVTIAKEFRKQEIKKGNLVTIDEKIQKNPNVKNLIGTPVIHWRMVEHNVPESGVYKKTKDSGKMYNTFATTIEQFNLFRQAGLDKAYVHLDGWGKRGYDNLHPYVLPPSAQTGGWEGMRALSSTCKDIGYSFGLHDQYRDYYQDSESYHPDHCVVDINGKKSYSNYWSGGAHNWLCTSLAKPYVERTYRELKENGVSIDGTYLDVFGIVMGDECYDPRHSITRTQSIRYRGECFNMLRDQGLIVSSEEIGCQMVKYLDLVHHAPYQLTCQDEGFQLGIPVPLTNLVYHDCVFVPWHTEGKGGWGIPHGDSGRMHCILNGQTPYFNNSMANYERESDQQLKERVRLVQEAAQVNAKVYNAEMVSHKFLDDHYRIQQTTFSNGYKITVNFETDTYKVERTDNSDLNKKAYCKTTI